MTNAYSALIVVLLFIEFGLETLVDTLNFKQLSAELPIQYQAEFKDFYEPSNYQKYLSYQRAHIHLDQVKRPIQLILTLAFILLGGFNTLDQWIRSLGYGEILTGLLYIGALSTLSFLIGLPFSIYNTFVIEERHGFNKTSPRTFVTDLLKGLVLSIILGAPILALLLTFFEKAGPLAWLYAWAALTSIQIILTFFAPAIILPLFNRFDPLPEGQLKNAIQEYAATQNFQLNGIFQMDSSKRSTKSNAFFTGFGKLRRLVLFDTLIQKQTTEELVAVLAHEIGHFKKRHILKSMIFSIISTGLLFYFLSFFLKNAELFEAFHMNSISVYASLVFIGFLYSPISRLLSILSNYLSRKYEFEADHFASETYGKPEALIEALKKLSMDNLSHLTPHPLKVFLEDTHPPVIQRIEALRKG